MAEANIAFQPQPLAPAKTMSGNPLDEKLKKDQPIIDFTEEQATYMAYLKKRMTTAQENRDRKHAEFSGKTYLQQYEENEKIAHTYIEQKQNEDEPVLSMGTIEAKLNALLSHIDSLNLTPEVLAYDKNKKLLRDIGASFTDVINDLAEHDGNDPGGDREKKMQRQRELLKQGTVFVQKDWVIKRAARKKLQKVYNGEFESEGLFTSKMQKVFEGIDTKILYGPNVYLGDITKYSMEEQPYMFTVEQVHYDEAKKIFGNFENWKYVSPGIPTSVTSDSTTGNNVGARTIYDEKFRLTNVKDNHVEIIRYQDPTRDEFEIVVNGIPMLPIGFPLSSVTPTGGFNVQKQILYTINSQFAYGKSFVSSGGIYEMSKILDEMIRLFTLKTRKSVTPPYVNISNKVISRRTLAPGNISMGIPPNALQPIGNEGQGVTNAEFNIFQDIQRQIENSTVSDIFQGQQASGGATATEVLEVQRQAKISLGLIIASCTMLEQKLGYVQLWIALSRWLEAVGKKTVDGNKLIDQFRAVSRETDIEGRGRGERRVTFVDGDVPRPEVIHVLQERESSKVGKPIERIFLSVPKLRAAKITWKVRVLPKERETSAFNKLQFREQLNDILALAQLGAKPNVGGLQDQLAQIYNADTAKLFQVQEEQSSERQEIEQLQQQIEEATGGRGAGNGREGARRAGGARSTEGRGGRVNSPQVSQPAPSMV